ncbi:MAG TPA: acyl-ACP desaturase [Dehalococcoidia bacterium]|nr:acyl-ACP desaturase [Dehalococcoidia bacterium]
MSKLPLKTSYPFTGHQPALSALERRTIPSREDVIAFYRTHERVSWSLTEQIDIDASALDVDALTDADIYVVESTMLVESNNPDYVANLLEYFAADQHACDFIMMWAVEEWKHYYALRDYLAKARVALQERDAAHDAGPDAGARRARLRELVEAALSDQVDDVRENSAENWGIPMHYLPVQVVASTTLQEFVTAEFYRNHARQTREPVLAKLEMLLGKDEARHEMFYEQKMRDVLDEHPELMPMVIDALKEFGMPGAYLIDRYEERRSAMENAAFPTVSAKRSAFARLFAKLERMVGHDRAMEVLVDGQYLAGGDGTGRARKPSQALISRLITAKVAG